MMPRLVLYSRKNCCLCDEMKEVIRRAARETVFEMHEIDIDGDDELVAKFGAQVPVLFIDGRKAFKYRVTAKQLRKRLEGGALSSWRWLVKKRV